jgi:hypothetical protein
MRDLGSQMRAYVESVIDPASPEGIIAGAAGSGTGTAASLDTAPLSVAVWWRRPVFIVVAAAIVTVLLVGGGVLLVTGGGSGGAADDAPSPTTVAPTAGTSTTTTTAPSTTTTAAPSTTAPAASTTTTTTTTTTTAASVSLPESLQMSWERLPDDEVFDDAWITAVTEGGPGLVAVGYVLEEPWPADWYSDAAVWVSSDGETWERTSDPAVFSATGETAGTIEGLIDVHGGPDGLTVLGFDGAGFSLWTSQDGESWTRSDTSVPGLVVEFDAGFVVVASDSIWFSADGVAWTQIADEVFLNAEVYEVVAGGPGVVAVGRIDPDDPSGAIWVSSDGLEWEPVAEEHSEAVRQFESVAADPDGTQVIAFGWGASLYSDDGFEWRVVEAPLGDPQSFSRGAWNGERLVIVGRDWGSSAAVWVSDDGGSTQYRLDPSNPAFAADTPDMNDIVLFGSRFVAVGGDRGFPQQGQFWDGSPMIGRDGRGAVWIGTWDRG